MRENFKKEIDIIIPLDEKLVVPAMDRGEPFMLRNANNPTGKAFQEMAELISKKLKTMVHVEAETA